MTELGLHIIDLLQVVILVEVVQEVRLELALDLRRLAHKRIELTLGCIGDGDGWLDCLSVESGCAVWD